jgi:hypothetical protein
MAGSHQVGFVILTVRSLHKKKGAESLILRLRESGVGLLFVRFQFIKFQF